MECTCQSCLLHGRYPGLAFVRLCAVLLCEERLPHSEQGHQEILSPEITGGVDWQQFSTRLNNQSLSSWVQSSSFAPTSLSLSSSTVSCLAFTPSAASICPSKAVSTRSGNNCRKQRSPHSARFPSTTCLDRIQIERLEDLPMSGHGVCPSVAVAIASQFVLSVQTGRATEQGGRSFLSSTAVPSLSALILIEAF